MYFGILIKEWVPQDGSVAIVGNFRIQRIQKIHRSFLMDFSTKVN